MNEATARLVVEREPKRPHGSSWVGVTSSLLISGLIVLAFGRFIEIPFDGVSMLVTAAIALIYLAFQVSAVIDRPVSAERKVTSDIVFSFFPLIATIVMIALRGINYFQGADSTGIGVVEWLTGFLNSYEWSSVAVIALMLWIDLALLVRVTYRLGRYDEFIPQR